MRKEYRNQGYFMAASFLTPPEVRALLADIEAISSGATRSDHDRTRLEMEPDQPPEGGQVRRIYEPCTYYPRFREFSERPDLLDTVSALLGPNLVFHYSKINMKPPAIGSVVEWHQDLAYYPLTNDDSVSILFYLDDADVGNGCLRVLPGEHRRGILNHTRDGWFQGRITESIDESGAVALEGKAGAAIFMHAMLPHASAPNSSGRPRRTLILSFRATDAFPVYLGETTLRAEAHVRHVRGQPAAQARFTFAHIPIPRYPAQTRSLYELQELSRRAGV